MNNEIISIAYKIHTYKGAYALLLGLGISREAEIPTGWDITLKLINNLALLYKESVDNDPEKWYKEKYGKAPDYSEILEELTDTREERLKLFEHYIEPTKEEFQEGKKVPTTAHQEIAKLVQEGYIRVIVTTNFDRLLEQSLKEFGIEPIVISNPTSVENSMPLIHSDITIIKINGDYKETSFLNLKSELEQYDERLENLLIEVFENFGLITSGWSADWDVALIDVLKRSNKFRFSNFFTYRSKPSKGLEDISSFRKGRLVQTGNADVFFKELNENIQALEKNNSQHPLSSKVALSRLKKYLAKEDYKIEFHDLMYDVITETVLNINSVEITNQAPNKGDILDVIEQYDKSLNTINSLAAEGVFWSQDIHYKSWLDSLKMIGKYNESRSENSYAIWSQIQYYPLLQLSYVIGVSAVSSNQFALIKKMLDLEIECRLENQKLIEVTSLNKIMREENIRSLYGGDKWSVTDVFFKSLRSFFNKTISTENDFETAFDYYDCIRSLYSLSKFRHSTNVPYGRWINNCKAIITNLRNRISKEQMEFELIKYGFFDNQEDLEEALKEFEEDLKRCKYWR